MAKKHEIVLTRHKMYFKFNNTRARAPFPQIFGMRGNNLGPEPRVVVQNWGPIFMAFYLDKSNEILTNQYSDLNNKKKTLSLHWFDPDILFQIFFKILISIENALFESISIALGPS